MTPIPQKYQPGGSGTLLQWRVYAPNNNPNGSWPTVLIIHGGAFKRGGPYQLAVEQLATLLSTKGYYVLVGCYRLAPPNRIPGQVVHDSSPAGVASGRPPQQTDDVMFLTQAARADSHCNGKLAIIGSSSGGALATYVGLYTQSINVTGRPQWTSADRPDCVVSFSGVYDLSDQTAYDASHGYDIFIDSLQNYTNTCDVGVMLADSPISLISGAATSFKPLFITNSDGDPVVEPRQIFDMQCALIRAGISKDLYHVVQIPDNSDHALDIWFDIDPATGRTVGDEVLDFLNANLN